MILMCCLINVAVSFGHLMAFMDAYGLFHLIGTVFSLVAGWFFRFMDSGCFVEYLFQVGFDFVD